MIYFPDKSDADELKELWSILFEGEEDFADLFFEKYFEKGDSIAYKIGDSIIGGMYLLWGNVYDNGETYKASFLYAGGVKPEYRHKGYMRKILQACFDYSREQGCSICFAVSALYCMELYDKLGMKRCSELDVITISPKKIEKSKIKPGNIEKNEFIELRNEYLHKIGKSLIWDRKTAEFIYHELNFSGEILNLKTNNGEYYATVCFENDYVLIRETNLPINMLCDGIDAIAAYYDTALTFKIYRKTDAENHLLFENTETMYYGHEILLGKNFDADKCYINLIAE